MQYLFFPPGSGEGTSGICKPRHTRTYVSTTLWRIMAIYNSPRCNADLPRLRRTDAGRSTRIIARSRYAQTCTCAILGALYARAAFIEHYLFPLPPSLASLLFLENIVEMYRDVLLSPPSIRHHLRKAKL